uniref:Uncharacterized protein n=1 Tax=Avena sativa TaxID=4498 RepID=A0ACD5ZMB5_AVESA
MGRGRGRGRKIIPSSRGHEDKGSSGEEVVPARKRRGRPQKQRPPAEKLDLAQAKNSVEGVDDYPQGGEGDDAKLKENCPEGNGNKRNRAPKEEEGSNPEMEENSSSTRSSNDESTTRSSGFRQNGSRRKSTPRRAAEAGL